MSQHMHDMTADDHVLTVLPLFHVGGLNIQTTPALQLGATVTLHARFTPDATLRRIEHDRPTLTVLVPATIQAVIEHPRWADDRPRLPARDHAPARRMCRKAWSMRFTRAACRCCRSTARPRPARSRSIRGSAAIYRAPARPACPACAARRASSMMRAHEVPPGTPGEVVVRGPNVFFEYWGNAAATAETLRDGWYRTGDIGMRDADGYFFIHDRKKNMIISGGENIYPAEVERVLLEHPDVAEAA